MSGVTDVDADAIRTGEGTWMGADLLDALAEHPLDCLDTEYPHAVGSVESQDGPPRPRDRHPVFFGCYDWHSAVHSHWSLVRQLRLFDDHPARSAIVESVEERLTAENVAAEVEYLDANGTFEKPYGWAWLLRLAAELDRWDDPRADEWRARLEPLEERVADLVADEFLPEERPFRVGTHRNSAFALQCVLDYARVVGDDGLASETTATARRFFADDRAYPAEYEPLGWDFLSPALVEADLMRRVMDPDSFADWFASFLPSPVETLGPPVDVDPESEGGVALHLVGLNLSRAWCLAGIASALDASRDVSDLEASAVRHAEAGLNAAFHDDYAGSHWLSSFALSLLTWAADGTAPSPT